MLKIRGIPEMQQRIKKVESIFDIRIKRALVSVLVDIRNWIVRNHEFMGGWINDTHVLVNSIGYTNIDDLEIGTNSITGSVYAGADYAVYVEFMPGHWVLSGGFAEFREKIMPLIAKRVKEQLL